MIKVFKYIFNTGIKPVAKICGVMVGIVFIVLLMFAPALGIGFLMESYSNWYGLLFIAYAVAIPITLDLLGVSLE